MSNLSRIAAKSLTKLSALQATYALALELIHEGIKGDFVECGVYAGAHPAVMAMAIMESGEGNRRVHLFDSFEGIPMAGERDRDWHEGEPHNRPFGPENVTSGISACSLEQVKVNMREWGIPPDLLVYHPGWFCNTLPSVKMGEIALLRLDADLYESTRLCVQYLYPNVVTGGWCCCDDWTLNGAREAVMSCLMEAENCPVYWRKQL